MFATHATTNTTLSPAMPMRRLGTSTIEVSLLCLGTMNWGQQNTEAQAFEQMTYALEAGINFWDTAEIYAVPLDAATCHATERMIGNYFATHGQRERVILATKVAGRTRGGITWLRGRDGQHCHNRENIIEALNGSLQRLQTDYIDLYQLHWPDRGVNVFGTRYYSSKLQHADTHFEDVVSTVGELIEAGKIREWGLSNETPWGVMQWFHWADKLGVKRPASIQNAYSLLNRQYEVALAEISHYEGIGLINYATLACGLLSGKYHNQTATPECRINKYPDYWARYDTSTAREATADYIALAKHLGITPTQLAMAFVNQQPFLSSNIIGVTSLAQLEECISSVAIHLDDDTLRAIDAIDARYASPCS